MTKPLLTLSYTERNFEVLKDKDGVMLAQQASTISNDYPDAFDYPGSSYLWIGNLVSDTEATRSRLNREEVAELALRLTLWSADASMRLREDPKGQIKE